jgi:hypothetical protein
MTDRYRFLKTASHDGQIVALIGDQEILGEDGIKSIRQAFNAHAAPLMRRGVLTMTVDEITRRLPELESMGMTESVAAFQRARECINNKVKAAAPA